MECRADGRGEGKRGNASGDPEGGGPFDRLRERESRREYLGAMRMLCCDKAALRGTGGFLLKGKLRPCFILKHKRFFSFYI